MPFDDSGSWRPNLKQEKFLALPVTIKEALYGGGAGSGKSEVLLMYAIVRGWTKHPKFKQLFTRRTFSELRNEIVPRTREIYPKFGATFNKSDMVWTFPSGAMIFFGHMENEDDARKYDSMEINLFSPDEITSYLEWQYLYVALTRVRSSSPELPSITRTAGMPGGIGHSWTRSRFIDKAPQGGVILKSPGGVKRIYIHATLEDNKKHIDPTYALSLNSLPEAERKAKLFGSWEAFEGQIFKEFRDRKYPDEPENAIHVIEPFEIPEWYPRVIGMDWGYSKPAGTWIGYGAIAPNGRVYIYREQFWQETKIEEWAGYVKYFIEKEKPRLIRLCKSAGQDRGQEHTILQQISSALNYNVELSNNSPGSRVAGKMLIHEYFRWNQKYSPIKDVGSYNDEKARWILRNRTMKDYQVYVSSFVPQEPETNLPKCQIFNTCPLLINAIKSCVHDKSNPQDVAEFPGDDPYDGFRYLLDSVEFFVNSSKDEFEKVQKQQELIQRLEVDKDWTAFYRNAKVLESESDNMDYAPRYSRRSH